MEKVLTEDEITQIILDVYKIISNDMKLHPNEDETLIYYLAQDYFKNAKLITEYFIKNMLNVNINESINILKNIKYEETFV